MSDPREIDAIDMEPVGEAGNRAIERAGQSLASRREQDNAPSPITPMAMLDRALANNASMETLEKLMALHERWEANQARKAFDAAMAAAKAEIPTIRKNREVDFTSQKGRTHYRHEDLAEIARTVSPILSRHGLSYRFRTRNELNEPIVVTCIITHRLGHFEETTLSGPRDDSGNKNANQQVGSTLTYLQRMTLKAALGLAATDDDDGQASGTGELISDVQEAELRKLIEVTSADEAKFCQYMGVPDIGSIPVAQFQRAVAALNRKRSAA